MDTDLDEATQETSPPTRLGSRRRRILIGCSIPFGLLALLAAFEIITWPEVGRLQSENPETTAFLERVRNRSPEAESVVPPIRWVSYAQLSPHLKRAVLVSEDIDFFSHQGFAVDEMEQAWKDFRKGKELRGASTLTQQLAKNLWLSPSRNPWRKVKEALLTVQLEKQLSKRRILEIYLNCVEYGPTVFGAENAARVYFGTSAAQLSETQGAALAAALPSPRRWHPGSDNPVAAQRRDRILQRMRRAQWLWKVL